MAKKVFTIGLSEIQYGTADPVGFMPAKMSKLGMTYQDSCKISQDEPEITEHYEEGASVPFVRFAKGKSPEITMQVVVSSLEDLHRLLGGRLEGERFILSKSATLNMAIRVVPAQGYSISIPNASITAKLEGDISSKGVLLISCKIAPQATTTGDDIVFEGMVSGLTLDKSVVRFDTNKVDSQGKGVTADETITTVLVKPEDASWLEVTHSGKTATVKIKAENAETRSRSSEVIIVAGNKTANLMVAQAPKVEG